MTARIRCETYFDITCSGVRNNNVGTATSQKEQQRWQIQRNQQRNWDTVLQILSLRTLPESISVPVKHSQGDSMIWSFDFVVPDINQIATEHDAVGYLRHDVQGVPMILGLDETYSRLRYLTAQDEEPNIWFKVL